MVRAHCPRRACICLPLRRATTASGAHLFIVAADRDRSPVAAGGKPHGVRIGHAPQRADPLRAGTARGPLADGPAAVLNHGGPVAPPHPASAHSPLPPRAVPLPFRPTTPWPEPRPNPPRRKAKTPPPTSASKPSSGSPPTPHRAPARVVNLKPLRGTFAERKTTTASATSSTSSEASH